MIRIDMIRSDTRHLDKRRRHQGRASCEAAGRRFETQGPAPIYKLATLLWLHGHGGEEFEVWDDVSPPGRPGGLAMTGRVRNWARLANGKPVFDRQAKSETDLAPDERELIARAAGTVTDLMESAPLAAGNGHTGVSRLSGGLGHPPGKRWPLYGACHRAHPGGSLMARKNPTREFMNDSDASEKT